MIDARPMFGPGSATWEVLRQPIYLLGGMRALLLQLADPAVAAGVADHSDFADRLFPRLRHTLDLVAIVALGSPDEAEQALREVERVHRPVRGNLAQGDTYRASDPQLKLWVLASLIDTVLEVERRYLGEWDEETRRRYYRESRQVMDAFGIEGAPSDLERFRCYVNRRLESVEVTDTALELSRHVLHPQFRSLPRALFAPFRAVTIDMLPPRLRTAYRLELTGRRGRIVLRVQAVSRAIVPRLPEWLRTFPLLHPIAGLRYRWERRSSQPRHRRPVEIDGPAGI